MIFSSTHKAQSYLYTFLLLSLLPFLNGCTNLSSQFYDFLPFIGIFLFLATVILVTLLIRPEYTFFLLLIAFPFYNIDQIHGRLFGVFGLSISNLMSALVLVLLLLHAHYTQAIDAKLRNYAVLFWLVIFYSIMYTSFQLGQVASGSDLSQPQYILYYFIRPLCIWMLFILVVSFISSLKDFIKITRIVNIAISLSAIGILLVVFYYFMEFASYREVRSATGDFLGMHANDYAVMFTLLVPFLLGFMTLNFISAQDKFIAFVTLMLAICVVIFSYSRACYVGVFLALCMFYWIYNRKKIIFFIFPAVVVFALFGPSSVQDRAMHGISKEGTPSHIEPDIGAVSAGRVNIIWPFLLNKFKQDKMQILVGKGKESAKKMGMHTHPHNAYFQVLFDVGIAGFIVFYLFYSYLCKKILYMYKTAKASDFRYFYLGGVIMFATYLILSIAGRSFYPDIRFIYFWIILGLYLSFYQLVSTSKLKTD